MGDYTTEIRNNANCKFRILMPWNRFFTFKISNDILL